MIFNLRDSCVIRAHPSNPNPDGAVSAGSPSPKNFPMAVTVQRVPA